MKTKIVGVVVASALVVVALFGCAGAEEASTGTISGWLRLAAEKASETRPVVLMSPYVRPAYSAFLPVWTLHAKYPESGVDHYLDYLEIGIGGKYEMSDSSKSAFLAGDVNLVGISARLWNWKWADEHLRRSKFPPIFVGPGLVAPLAWDDLKNLNLRRDLRLMISVAF
jgi:hypothetical protein